MAKKINSNLMRLNVSDFNYFNNFIDYQKNRFYLFKFKSFFESFLLKHKYFLFDYVISFQNNKFIVKLYTLNFFRFRRRKNKKKNSLYLRKYKDKKKKRYFRYIFLELLIAIEKSRNMFSSYFKFFLENELTGKKKEKTMVKKIQSKQELVLADLKKRKTKKLKKMPKKSKILKSKKIVLKKNSDIMQFYRFLIAKILSTLPITVKSLKRSKKKFLDFFIISRILNKFLFFFFYDRLIKLKLELLFFRLIHYRATVHLLNYKLLIYRNPFLYNMCFSVRKRFKSIFKLYRKFGALKKWVFVLPIALFFKNIYLVGLFLKTGFRITRRHLRFMNFFSSIVKYISRKFILFRVLIIQIHGKLGATDETVKKTYTFGNYGNFVRKTSFVSKVKSLFLPVTTFTGVFGIKLYIL